MKLLLLELIHYGFMFVQAVMLVHILLSWVPVYHRPRWMYYPLVRWADDTGFRILRPFRQLFVKLGVPTCPIDFSPIIAFFVLSFLADLLQRLVWQLPIP